MHWVETTVQSNCFPFCFWFEQAVLNRQPRNNKHATPGKSYKTELADRIFHILYLVDCWTHYLGGLDTETTRLNNLKLVRLWSLVIRTEWRHTGLKPWVCTAYDTEA